MRRTREEATSTLIVQSRSSERRRPTGNGPLAPRQLQLRLELFPRRGRRTKPRRTRQQQGRVGIVRTTSATTAAEGERTDGRESREESPLVERGRRVGEEGHAGAPAHSWTRLHPS